MEYPRTSWLGNFQGALSSPLKKGAVNVLETFQIADSASSEEHIFFALGLSNYNMKVI